MRGGGRVGLSGVGAGGGAGIYKKRGSGTAGRSRSREAHVGEDVGFVLRRGKGEDGRVVPAFSLVLRRRAVSFWKKKIFSSDAGFAPARGDLVEKSRWLEFGP